MPNIIPPIVSSSPPPLDPIEDEDDNENETDDFGDFAAADFTTHSDPDSSMPKHISDTSWTLSASKQSIYQPQVHENGVIPHVRSSEEGYLKSPGEILDDDEISQNADNTSHDSVVSAVTDSGHCSASQNSNGTSPMPNMELEFEPSVKSASYAVQNGNECPLPIETSSCCSVADKEENILAEPTGNGTLEIDLRCEKPMTILENRQPSLSHSTIEASTNFSDTDVELTVSNQSFNNADEEKKSESLSERSASFDTLDPDCRPEPSDSCDGHEENECLRAMIIPEMPSLDDDDKEEDDFGEFSGITSVVAAPGTQRVVNNSEEHVFDSPSRRPTLVLTDEIGEASEEVMSDPVLNEGIDDSKSLPADSLLVKTHLPTENSSDCPPTATDTGSTSFPLSSSTEDPLADEFADFSHAEVANDDSNSDVWAQAAQTSTLESTTQQAGGSDFDDFDDFESAEFQSSDTVRLDPAPRSLFDLKEIQSNLNKLLKENFPIAKEGNNFSEIDSISSGLSGNVLDVEESSIWQGLRDMEATPSLSFQWPGSHANRGLLGALNIDSRNILFGPKWNTVVPRFAANLGFSPLEPVRAVQHQPPPESSSRSEIIQPQMEENVKSSSDQGFQEMVPAAQFDWSDSGLINPLDSNKDPINGPLATTAASGNPVLTSTPLQVEQLLANSKRSTPLVAHDKKDRDASLSTEAVRVLDTLPELAFLSARMLMFPVQGDRNENKL